MLLGPLKSMCSLVFRIPVNGQKFQNPVILSIIHHRQNPLEFTQLGLLQRGSLDHWTLSNEPSTVGSFSPLCMMRGWYPLSEINGHTE
jgi:hypothetical protein